MLNLSKKVLFLAMTSAVMSVSTVALAADNYPQKPITFVIGFPPGTSTDAIARIIGEKISSELKQPVIVENKPGVGGSLAVTQVSKAKPDGYTLVLSATAPMNINPHVYKSISYDPIKDFEPIGQTTWLPYVLVSNNSKGIKSFSSLIDYAKNNPGALTYASIGNGTTSHLLMELLTKSTGTKMTHVPYSGSSQAQTDIIGGNVDITFDTLVSALPHIKSGKLNPLAVSVNQRAQLAPDIPTIEELGIPNFNMGAWLGFFAPKGTPEPIIQKLHQEINKAVTDPVINQRLTALGSEVVTSNSPEEFSKMVSDNYHVWGNIVKDTGLEKK